MIALNERIEGGITGLLIGDALGVPYEFHLKQDIPPASEIEFTPPPGFQRSHSSVLPGTWSDDGAHALVLLASLLHCSRLDLDDLGRRLLDWYTSGYKAVDNVVFDVGVQTSQSLVRLQSGIPPGEAGPSDERANGNGSLMRVLPLAIWHKGTDQELVADAHNQSVITHGHIRSQICCALYCLWARYTMAGLPDSWPRAVASLRTIYRDDSRRRHELEWSIRPDDPPEGDGTGYVVDCLRSARWAMEAGNYQDVVRAAISLGRDTDTTACVAGGIAGLRDGIKAIPQGWKDGLRGKALFQTELAALINWRSVR